jgi:hypothetical protein
MVQDRAIWYDPQKQLPGGAPCDGKNITPSCQRSSTNRSDSHAREAVVPAVGPLRKLRKTISFSCRECWVCPRETMRWR